MNDNRTLSDLERLYMQAKLAFRKARSEGCPQKIQEAGSRMTALLKQLTKMEM